jgi:hypothetical protein
MIILKEEEASAPSFIQRLMYLYIFCRPKEKKEMHCSLATNISTLEIQ